MEKKTDTIGQGLYRGYVGSIYRSFHFFSFIPILPLYHPYITAISIFFSINDWVYIHDPSLGRPMRTVRRKHGKGTCFTLRVQGPK